MVILALHAGRMNTHALLSLYRDRGALAYDGEGVTQLQHGWQCAALARRAQAPVELQLAAWLHDLGHLLTGLPGSPTLQGIDDGHEHTGARVLESVFGPRVSEPVALHVEAKRALVSSQPGYFARLSADSTRSLALQGGPLDEAQLQAFLLRPHARDAMRLRVWDDEAKAPELRPASCADALGELEQLMAQVLALRT